MTQDKITESATLSEKSAKGIKVKQHPDASLLEQMILSGWAPRKIEAWLKRKYPDDSKKQISERTLLSFRKNFIALNKGLPASYYATKLKELDIVIDSLQELYNAIEMQKRRVALNLQIEDNSNVALPDTRKEMELLAGMLAKSIELEMKLGIRKEEPQRLEVKSMNLDMLVTKYLEEKTPVTAQ